MELQKSQGRCPEEIDVKSSMEAKSCAESHLIVCSERETDKKCGAKGSAGDGIKNNLDFQPYLESRRENKNHAIFPDRMRDYIQVEAAGKGKSDVCGWTA
jgi:hypothetical protein